ncbi:Sporulation-specific protein 1 [Phytophthora citrophthora]|uniref:Sporulation-specific protein 1 n=1 Tax=Phytophthora citrophthora TaxID=4793 RepID=A0AAD9LBM6_9STRA|nr:Sporulation-specific protein 1 [Phytophthora citrophthora]
MHDARLERLYSAKETGTNMQRLVQRDKGAPVVSEGDEENEQEDVDIDNDLPHELADAEQQSTPVKLASRPTTLALDSLPGKFCTSARYVNLHSYDPQSQRVEGYAETKIGGHELDHKRPFYSDWQQQLHGPLKTAVWGAVGALGAGFSDSSVKMNAPSSQARTSQAYMVPKPEVLVYSAVKIGGHPLDHVPFLSRGLPSRPLLGYVPESARHEPLPPVFQAPGLSSAAVTYEIAPNVSNFRRVYNFVVATLCVLNVWLHVRLSTQSTIERASWSVRAATTVAVEAVVFTNYILRMEPFSARTVSELDMQQESNGESASNSLAGSWKQGGVLAALSFIAGRFVPTRPRKKQQKKADAVEEAKRLVAEVLPDEADELLVDGVANLSKEAAKAEVTIAKGPERWSKRVQGLHPPSKLLKFSFVRTLGVGNFAEVMLVENRKGQLTVLKESDKLPEAANEISILSRVRSPHIVQIQQYFIEEIGHRHFAYIEMEYCDGGDLRELLEEKGRLEGDDFDSVFRQLCIGLKEIHRHGIVHRDLKPGNVLLTSDGTTKIADFGVSTYLESDLLTHHAAGTLAFMAPEVRRYFLGEAVSYDAKADIWSLGALAVAILTGNPEPRVATRPVEELVDDLKEKKLDKKYIRLVEGTLTPLPADRPSLEELLEAFPSMNSRL